MIQLLVFDVKRSNRTTKRVVERTQQGLCCWFDENGVECKEPHVSNGQCRKHVNHTNAEQAKLPSKAAKTRFISEEIRAGRRLDGGEQRKFKRMASSPTTRNAIESVPSIS